MQRIVLFVSIWGFGLLLAVMPGRSLAQAGRSPVKSPAPKVSYSGRFCVPDQECSGDSIQFNDSTATTIKSSWSFGDGSTATGKQPKHIYTRPGPFTIVLKRTGGPNPADSVAFSVTVGSNPQSFNKWRTDTTICKGQVINLDPYGSPNATYKYLWYPKGDTTQVLKVDSSGCYSVEAIDRATGCSYQNKINVKVCGEKSQQQGAKWYFGGNAGLDFGGGSPTPIDDSKINTAEGSSSIANTKGQLQFYTDGITIYDKNGVIMKSVIPGDTAYRPLGGSGTSTQSALIVPKPTCRGCEYLYYVYTTSEIRGTKVLTYSVVDMRENKGKGAIVARNIPVVNQSTERSTSVRNDKDSTYWVITHDYGGNTFRVYHLTKGETAGQQTFNLGMPQDTVTKAEGYIKVGPADTTSAGKSARPMAMVVPGPPRNYVELFSFDDATGKISGPVRRIDLGPYPPKAYGVEFSPDGKGLYVSLNDSSRRGASYIVRYDISQKDSLALANSRILVDSSTVRQYGALQIAADGRIYVAVQGANSLGVINKPNAGLIGDFQFNPAGQSLGGKVSQLGLPNLVTNFNTASGGPALMKGDSCAGRPTQFQITPACPPLKEFYTLDFGDKTRPFSGTTTQTTHTYSTPGTYNILLHVQVMRTDGAGVCLDTLLKQTITIIATPDKIDLGPDIGPLCTNGVTLDAKVQATQYVWVRNGQIAGRGRTLLATRSGTYIVFAANISCYQSDTIQVTLLRPPVLDLGRDTSYCAGGQYNLTVPQQTWNGFTWSNGQTTKTIAVSKPGLYSLTATNAQGCTNTDSIRIAEAPRPRLSAVLSGPTTCTGADGRIQLTPSPTGTYSYSWTSSNTTLPTTTALLNNLRVGVYAVRATSLQGCAVDSSFNLNSPANPLKVSATTRPALCSKPASGSAVPIVTGGTGLNYAWYDKNNKLVSSAPTLTSAVSGTYSVAVSDANGCTAVAGNLVIGLDSTGFANLGPDRLKCVNDTVVLTPVDGSLVMGNVYLWSNGSNNRSIVASASGLYSVRVRNTATGCVGHDTVRVSFNPKPVVSAGPAVGFCQSLSAVQLVGATPAGGQWQGRGIDSTGRFIPAPGLVGSTITATYSVTVLGCANSADRAITVKPLPRVDAGPDASLCAGVTAQVRATGSAGAAFQWNIGPGGAVLQAPQTGRYIVTATLDGCQARDTVSVTILPVPVIALPGRVGICFPDGIVGSLQVSGDSTLRFLWPQLNQTTRRVQVGKAGLYFVKATGANGCTTTDSTLVVEECEPRVFVPDAFSPNGDRINDQLEVFSAYVIDYELRIYNRWGEIIFVSNSPEQKWDGIYRGEMFPTMLYPFVVVYRSRYFPERPPVVKRGSILLTK